MARSLRMTEEQLVDFEANSGRGLPKATKAEMRRQAEERAKNEAMNRRVDAIAIQHHTNNAKVTAAQIKKALTPKKRSKYGAKPTEVDGIRFDSKLEAARYQELKLLRIAGRIRYFTRQIPFDLPGGVRYFADFMLVSSGSEPIFEDCKGIDTPVSRLKRKQVETLYRVKIRIIKKARD